MVSAEFGRQQRVPKHERGQCDGCATYQVELKAKNLANWLCAVEIKGAPGLGEVVSSPVLRCSSGESASRGRRLPEVDFLVLFVCFFGLKSLESIAKHQRFPL